ncbi:hypothetical protein DFJ77DRAFT_510301 [Powellomyces hirtus]|nr:hypothetical protein DFJ77DRAFT_510301 [Powellomyces hirtus]
MHFSTSLLSNTLRKPTGGIPRTVEPRNPAAGFFKAPPKAPWRYYVISFAFGFAVGSALEYSVIKAGYYDIMRWSEARKVAKDLMEMEEAEAMLEEYKKTGKLPSLD